MQSPGRRLLSLLLCLLLLVSLLPQAALPAAAASRTLLLEQAQGMAVAASRDITKKTNEIILKQVKYVEAVDGIKAKVKNLRSFRWSPLINFKLPEKLDLTQEYDLNIKPLTLQAELDTLRHEVNDLRYQALADATDTYTQVFLLQEKVRFTQTRLDTAQAELSRNQARLAAGSAAQSDVDNMTKKVEKLTAELSGLKREFQLAKESLSDLIGLDVTSGYLFRNGLKQLALPREALESVVQYTLQNDHGFYAAKMAASTAYMNLTSYESFMRGQYGSRMNYIQTFLDLAKSGQDVDYAAFMLQYKQMLTALDAPWNKQIRIIFFTFTLEWFKGAIDGTRYIEDEIYAVYTACMDYAAAKREQEAAETALRKQVEGQYELLTTAWNSYRSMAGTVEDDRAQLDRVTALNRLGRAGYDEVAQAQEVYETDQLAAVDALVDYNTLLSGFDRLTCGAASRYFQGAGLEVEGGGGGDSFSRLDPIEEPYYYIYTTVADLTFHIGVSIPEGFTPAITQFEVWRGDIQLGARLDVGQELRHLTLDYGGDSMLTLRLYGPDGFVAQCEIDASVPRDRLDLGAGESTAAPEVALGTYTVTTTALEGLSTSALTLHLNAGVTAKTYTISYGTNNVFTSDPLPVTEPFAYLTLLIASLGDVTLTLYDSGGNAVGSARFEPKSQTIHGSISA